MFHVETIRIVAKKKKKVKLWDEKVKQRKGSGYKALAEKIIKSRHWYRLS